jgi:hypothetical protein
MEVIMEPRLIKKAFEEEFLVDRPALAARYDAFVKWLMERNCGVPSNHNNFVSAFMEMEGVDADTKRDWLHFQRNNGVCITDHVAERRIKVLEAV